MVCDKEVYRCQRMDMDEYDRQGEIKNVKFKEIEKQLDKEEETNEIITALLIKSARRLFDQKDE